MFSNFLGNKKGQAGETMTWIAATIIIVIILVVSILLTTLTVNSNKTVFYAADKQQDVIATSTMISFLESNQTKNLTRNQDYPDLQNEARIMLAILPMPTNIRYWNFELYDNNSAKQVSIGNPSATVLKYGWHNFFDTSIIGDNSMIRFWATCQGGTCG